jgi:hypothetical protein
MPDTLHRLALHADSARERPLERPAPTLTLAASYLPGHVVLTLEQPLRAVVVSVEQLIEALQSI